MTKDFIDYGVVGEIGVNHNGNVELAKKLIDIAKDCGCSAVKFQKRTVDIVYTPEELAQERVSPFGTTNGDLKYGLEFGHNEYAEIRQYCRDKHIDFGVSCWDEASVDFMEHHDPDFYKIASACLTDIDLLKKTTDTGRPVLLSTGMSTDEQIYKACSILGDSLKLIYHCTSTYPTDIKELNMKCLWTITNYLHATPAVGFSSHSMNIYPCIMAMTMGVDSIEVHITDDNNRWGSDQKVSLEPDKLKDLCTYFSNQREIFGDGIKKVYDSEIPIMNKLRRVKQEVQ